MEKHAFIEPNKIIEAQKYEFDKKQINDFYGFKKKVEFQYNIIQKKIIFAKENTINKINKKLKYSNYLVFRSLLQSEYDLEDMKEEMENGLQIINYSKNLRNDLYKYFNIDQSEINKTSNLNNSFLKNKKSNINNILLIDDFLKKCKLLKIKENIDIDQNLKTNFQIFSNLDKPSDEFSANSLNFKKLNINYFKQKQKLLKCFNRKHFMINYINKIKDSLIKITPDNLKLNIKDKFSSEFIDGLYDNRDNAYYFPIDSFFSKYNITPYKVKDEEKDLYKQIYSILSKNNYLNFLSFLYTKNDLFKLIYDEFSNKNFIYENVTLSEFNNENLNSENNVIREIHHINAKDLISKNDLYNDNLNYSLKKKIELYEKLIGNNLFIKIACLKDNLELGDITQFFDEQKSENSSEISKDYYDMDVCKYLIKCSELTFDDLLLINKKNIFTIFSYNEEFIEEEMSKINIYKISKKELINRLEQKVINTLFHENKKTDNSVNLINNFPCSYYILKINDNSSTEKFEDSEEDNRFFIFKILDKYKEYFENILNNKYENQLFEINNINKEEEKNENILQENKIITNNKILTKQLSKDSNSNIKFNLNKQSTLENKDNNFNDKSSLEKELAPIIKIKNKENPSNFTNSNISSNDIKNIIKENNLKNTDTIVTEKNKKYLFDFNDETYTFEITDKELSYITNKGNNGIYFLKNITISNIKNSNGNFIFDILNENKWVYTIIDKNKEKIEEFYFNLKKCLN